MSDRFALAAADRNIVIGVTGLLAAFNDAGVLDPLDVSAAITIGRLLGESDETVLLAAALAVRGTRFGHVCIRPDTIRDAVVVDGVEPEDIEGLPWPDPAAWAQLLAASPLVGDGTGDEPLVSVDGRLYLERYFRYEERVAALIDERCGSPYRHLSVPMERSLATLLGSGPNRQLDAAVASLTRRFAVIAGGPGTGKTHTIGAILAALAADGPESFPSVALCAPTGKAAARLGEAIDAITDKLGGDVHETVSRVTPSTVHRLLGWRPGRGVFVHDEAHPLPHDIVIVDEMSMVSLPLAGKLLAAVDPAASVVLVGDPFQLESIEAGTVLSDVVDSETPGRPGPIDDHVVVLERVHRFDADSAMADFAQAVRMGDADEAMELLSGGHDSLMWVPDRDAPEFAGLWERVITARSDVIDLARAPADARGALTALTQVAVLCARRHGQASVAQWGREIEAGLDQRFIGLRYGGEWYAGRPVMITSNDYRLELFNGDIGVTVESEDGLRVVFDRGGVRQYQPSRLGEHSTVHAMTIHKSQGSQFDEVVVVLPDEASRLLTRELLYTAVTRARSRVWLLAEEDVVRQAVTRSVERASGLGERLWRADSRTP
jgi:exodeoxyribonuclease V alpha subunit